MLAFRKNNGNGEIIRFGIHGNFNRLNKNSKWKLFRSKNSRPMGAMEEHNFLTSDVKTDFGFWSDFI